MPRLARRGPSSNNSNPAPKGLVGCKVGKRKCTTFSSLWRDSQSRCDSIASAIRAGVGGACGGIGGLSAGRGQYQLA